ncbi:SDR family NAD(P)-dependent oxidoreductase [Micromonospora sp. NPDC049523]|uniref:SDR family NAD(P)-dependent oxidoreductase n=1 Tax=Micromonospora sp. NPDC049523 TaxID=3155921 RepID=UPI0034159E43
MRARCRRSGCHRGIPAFHGSNVASWAEMMGASFISFYNASKYALIGLTESMYYDLALLDIHAVLAVPGTTKTPLLAKTTDDGTASLTTMPPEGQDRYRPYFERLATLGERSASMPLLGTPEQVAAKLLRLVETRRPGLRYDLTPDAKPIDGFVTRLLPLRGRAEMNPRMYRLPRRDTT